MIETPVKRTSDVPPAFYRDSDPPPPPPDDPHWGEWWFNDRYEQVPRWLIYALPALVIFAAAFHWAIILLILRLSQ